MEKKNKKGITIVILVITIIIILILATAVVINMVNNNPVSNSNKTVFLSDLHTFQDELDTYILMKKNSNLGNYDSSLLQADQYSLTYNGKEDNKTTIKEVITSLDKKYEVSEFEIVNGKLIYKGTEKTKQEWAMSTSNISVQTLPLRLDIISPDITIIDKGDAVTYTIKITSNSIISNVNFNNKIFLVDENNKLIQNQPIFDIKSIEGTDIDKKREFSLNINTNNLDEGKYKLKIMSGAVIDSNNLTNESDLTSDLFELREYVVPNIPVILVNPTTITKSAMVSIFSTTTDATIQYSIDDMKTWNEYTNPFELNQKVTVYAKSVRKGLESNIVNKIINNIDNIRPVVNISDPSKDIAKIGDTITYTVTYSDINFKEGTLNDSNVVLNKTGTANGKVSVAGNGNTRVITISNMTGEGTLGVTIPADTASDIAGNMSLESLPSKTFVVDNVLPVIQSITTNNDGYKKAGDEIILSVNYSEVVVGNAPTMNIIFGNGNTESINSEYVNGKTINYKYIVQDKDNGVLSIDSYVNGTLKDIAGNGVDLTIQNFVANFIADTIKPTVEVSSPSKNTAKYNDIVIYNIKYTDSNFKESILKNTDVILNKTGSATGTVSIEKSGNTGQVKVLDIKGNGTLGISLNSGTCLDLAGNSSDSVGPSNVFNVDASPITITDISLKYSSGNIYKKKGDVISIEVTYSKPIIGTVQNIDISFGSGIIRTLSNGTINLLKVTYIYTIQNDDNGELNVKSINGGTLVDNIGNPVDSSNLPSVIGSAIADNTVPTISKIDVIPTGYGKANDQVSLKVTFSENVTGNAPALQVAYGTSSNTYYVGGGNIYSPTNTYTYKFYLPYNENGRLSIKSYSNNTLVDQIGNRLNLNTTSVDGSLILDTISPVNVVSEPSKTIAKSGDIVTYTVTYSDENFDTSTLTESDIILNKGNTANAKVSVSGTGTTRTITLSNIVGDGYLGISIVGETGRDLGGNFTKPIYYSSTFNVDSSLPVINISTNGAIDVKKASTYVFTYDEGNSGINTCSYVWDKQNLTKPSEGWSTFRSGSTIEKDNVRGTYYLWIKVTDKAGNVAIYKSSSFYINSEETYEYGNSTLFNYTGDFKITTSAHYLGTHSFTNAHIGDNQTSKSEFYINDISNDGYQYYLSYYYKTSTEKDKDLFKIYLNDVLKMTASGNNNWTYNEIKLNSNSSNKVILDYTKNNKIIKGSDSVYIDNIYIKKNGLIDPVFTILSSENGSSVIQIDYSLASTVKEYSTNGWIWMSYTGPITTNNKTIYARSRDNDWVQSETTTLLIN